MQASERSLCELAKEAFHTAQAAEAAIRDFARRTHDVPIRRLDWYLMIADLMTLALGVSRWERQPEAAFRQRLRAALLTQSRCVKEMIAKQGFRLADTPTRPALDDTDFQKTTPLLALVVGRIHDYLHQWGIAGDAPVDEAILAFCHYQLALAMTDPEAPASHRNWHYYHLGLTHELESPFGSPQRWHMNTLEWWEATP